MLMQSRFGLRTKLLLSILAILVGSYTILLFSTMKTLSASIRAEIDRNLETNLRFAHSRYFDRTNIVRYSLLQPLNSPVVLDALRKKDFAWLSGRYNNWRRVLSFLDMMLFLDQDRKVVFGAPSLTGTQAQLPYVVDQAISARKPMVSTEIVPISLLCRSESSTYCVTDSRPKDSEVLMVTMALPLFDNNGNLLGCIVTGEVLNDNDNLPSQMKGEDVDFFITQKERRIASSFPKGATGIPKLAPEVVEVLEHGEQYRGELRNGKVVYETAIDPLMNSRGEFVGSFSVAVSTERFKAMRRQSLANIGASALVGILCCFGIAYFATRRLTDPVGKLVRAVKRIEEGDLDQHIEGSYGDEIGILASSFNRMVQALKERDRIINLKTEDLQELNEQLERKVAERTTALTMEMGRLEAVLTSMAEGVVVTDRENNVILYNPAAQQMFELVPYRVLGQSLEEICTLGGFAALCGSISGITAQPGGPGHREALEVKGKKLDVHLSSLADDKGAFAGMVISIRDVTMEQEVDRMKTEFISTVSHELKTPLTSMKGSLQLLLNRGKWLTETERQLLTVCFRNTQRLIRLISEILDISRIESGGMVFNMRPVSMGEVAVYAVEEIKSLAMGRSITIVNTIGEHLPKVFGDSDRLIQVMTNLLSNAVKFSPEGKVVIVSAQQDGNYVIVSVADRGKIIEWTDREKLFKKFQQIENVDRQKSGGTGLGLAICKEIVERHHGRIYYTAAQEQGNVFSFAVPIIGEEHGKGQDSHR